MPLAKSDRDRQSYSMSFETLLLDHVRRQSQLEDRVAHGAGTDLAALGFHR